MGGHATFRPAVKAERSALAVLVDIAGEGLPAHLWSTLRAPGQSILEVGRERAARETGGFSYRNALSRRSKARSPLASSATGSTIPTISGPRRDPPLVRPLVLLEAKAPGSWYVNVLATFPEFRQRGLGMALLGIAEEKARAGSATGVKRHRRGRERAGGRLYATAGYEARATEPIFAFPGCPHGGDWLLMVKPLPSHG